MIREYEVVVRTVIKNHYSVRVWASNEDYARSSAMGKIAVLIADIPFDGQYIESGTPRLIASLDRQYPTPPDIDPDREAFLADRAALEKEGGVDEHRR